MRLRCGEIFRRFIKLRWLGIAPLPFRSAPHPKATNHHHLSPPLPFRQICAVMACEASRNGNGGPLKTIGVIQHESIAPKCCPHKSPSLENEIMLRRNLPPLESWIMLWNKIKSHQDLLRTKISRKSQIEITSQNKANKSHNHILKQGLSPQNSGPNDRARAPR